MTTVRCNACGREYELDTDLTLGGPCPHEECPGGTLGRLSYAVYVILKGEEPTTNACRYATAEEADRAGSELLSRWFQPTGFEVRVSGDPVNYEFPAGAGRATPIAKEVS